MLIEIEDKILAALERDPPFSAETGWYPYVRPYGFVRSTFSPRYNFPAIRFSWMEYRQPANPVQVIDKITEAWKAPSIGLEDAGFNINKRAQIELLLFVEVMRTMQRSMNLRLRDLDLRLLNLVTEAVGNMSEEVKKLIPTDELSQSSARVP